VEQDLLLSRLAIGIAADPVLRSALAWRGGTCLHKLHLTSPRRYSEDLDFVLVEQMEHRTVLNALQAAADRAEMTKAQDDVSSTRVNLWATVQSAAGTAIRIKVEVSCADVAPVMPLIRLPHEVRTRWWSGSADVLTFAPAELVGTKFRALAQRRKGRDLSDLWLAWHELRIDDVALARAGDHYLQHEGISPSTFRLRLAEHALDPDFRRDLDVLTVLPYEGFDTQAEVRRLIRWSDERLDPLSDARRNPNALRRERQQWAKDGAWAEGRVRCVEYEERDGGLSRCVHWFDPGRACPVHGESPA
jgi:predicted nucleotidyltransferase component of viral defense system